jgi:hypothetical protein
MAEPDPAPTWPFDLAAVGFLLAAVLLMVLAALAVVAYPGQGGTAIAYVLAALIAACGGVAFPVALGLALGRRLGRTALGGVAGLGCALSLALLAVLV